MSAEYKKFFSDSYILDTHIKVLHTFQYPLPFPSFENFGTINMSKWVLHEELESEKEYSYELLVKTDNNLTVATYSGIELLEVDLINLNLPDDVLCLIVQVKNKVTNPNCLNPDRTPDTPCKLSPAGFCKGKQRYVCRNDRSGCGRSYMENAKPVGRPPNNDGLTKADRVRKCLGVMGTSGTGKTWYVVRDAADRTRLDADCWHIITAVVLGSRRSVQADYPDHSIALLSGHPAGMRRWIIREWKLDFKLT